MLRRLLVLLIASTCYGFINLQTCKHARLVTQNSSAIGLKSCTREQQLGEEGRGVSQWVDIILNGYKRSTGQDLIPDRASMSLDEQAMEVMNADFAVLAHDFLRDPQDPIYCYGNKFALDTFCYSFEEFTSLPSRLCVASADAFTEREKYLKDVKGGGKGDGYSGTRVTKDGRLFTVENVVLFNLYDTVDPQLMIGQAATFKKMHWL